jgi:hypothetical protein
MLDGPLLRPKTETSQLLTLNEVLRFQIFPSLVTKTVSCSKAAVSIVAHKQFPPRSVRLERVPDDPLAGALPNCRASLTSLGPVHTEKRVLKTKSSCPDVCLLPETCFSLNPWKIRPAPRIALVVRGRRAVRESSTRSYGVTSRSYGPVLSSCPVLPVAHDLKVDNRLLSLDSLKRLDSISPDSSRPIAFFRQPTGRCTKLT